MSQVIEQKFNDFMGAFEEFKKANDKQITELKSGVQASAATLEKMTAAEKRLDDAEANYKSVLAAVERSAKGNGGNEEAKGSAHLDAQMNYMRKGIMPTAEQMKQIEAEAKGMSVHVDEEGGFTVREELSSEIVKKIEDLSPMRSLCSVLTIGSDSIDILQDLEDNGYGWVGETEDRPETATAKLKQINIPVHELYAMPSATQKILDDSYLNIETWLSDKTSGVFAKQEALAFLSGNGDKKPKGILAYGNGTGFGQIERVATGLGQGLIGGDACLELIYKLASGYVSGANVMMHRQTEKAVRKLKTTDGQYLWQPGLQAGAPSMLLGSPIVNNPDMYAMTGTAATDADKEVMIFGNFKSGYQIVDRVGIRVLRDNITKKGFVLFYTTKRVGGAVKDFSAFKVLKTTA